jgi:hypothetical protein
VRRVIKEAGLTPHRKKNLLKRVPDYDRGFAVLRSLIDGATVKEAARLNNTFPAYAENVLRSARRHGLIQNQETP